MQSSNELEKEKQLSVNITDKFISLSDLYDSAKFVPLENGEQCMIGYAKKTIEKNNNIFLFDKEPYPSIKVFSSNGKYIRSIGRIGHGKGEYVDIDDFTISSNGDTIFVLCNNIIFAYNKNNSFLFSKDINIDGIVRRFECCNRGYVCLTEYKGNDYLLHFMDYNFNVKKELISSDGKIIKEPSEVIYPIQIDGEKVWYYNCFNSKFYVINTNDNYNVVSYKINTKDAYKLEQFENYTFTSQYDAVTNYFVVNGKIFGTFHSAINGEEPFLWDINCNEIVTRKPDKWIPHIKAVQTDYYYSILEQDVFLRLSKQMAHLKKFNNNYFDIYSDITEKNNFILVKLYPKK